MTMNFKPVNNHLEILPIKKDSFMASQETVHEECGLVVSVAEGVTVAQAGQRVHFDSWMAAKYEDKDGNVRWLVPDSAIRAVEHEISEE